MTAVMLNLAARVMALIAWVGYRLHYLASPLPDSPDVPLLTRLVDLLGRVVLTVLAIEWVARLVLILLDQVKQSG